MTGILYLVGTKLKNRILMLRRKPAQLILYIIVIASITGTMLISMKSSIPKTEALPSQWMVLIFAAYVGLFYFVDVFKGLSSGNSFFDMNDVNFLFTGPINPKVILGYGLLNQAGKTLLASLFILVQGNTLQMFGFKPSSIFVFFGAFAFSVLMCEVLALLIYMYTNQKAQRKNLVRILCVVPLLPFVIQLAQSYVSTLSVQDAVLSTIDSGVLGWFPIVGWSAQGVVALTSGQYMQAALFGGLNLVAGVVLILLVAFGKTDYYEDVLVATETTFAQKRAAAEGNLTAIPAGQKRSVKVREQGMWGNGAQVLFGKHILESFRENPLKLLDKLSLFMIVAVTGLAIFVGSPKLIIGVLAGTMYMQVFLIGTGRGLKELYSPYIYLIPASSFSKIVWSNMEVVLKNLVESVLIFLPAGIIVGENLLTIFMCIVARSVFSLVLVSINLLSMRIFKNVSNTAIMMFLYMGFVIVVMVPGVLMAAVAGVTIHLALGLFFLSAWELLLGGLFLFLSRGVLDTCDIQTMPQKS